MRSSTVMKACRITFRFFAILFGLAGIILLAWLGYESYSLGRHARQINQEFFTTVDRGIRDLDEKCSELHETFDRSVIQLEELERSLRNSGKRIIDNRVTETVATTARAVSARMDQATGVMELTADLLDVALRIPLRPNKGSAAPDAPPGWEDRVRELQNQARTVTASLKDLQQQLSQLQSTPREVLEKRDLTERLLRIIGKVEGVRDVLANVHTNLIALRGNLTEKRTEYDTFLGHIWWIVLGVALWMGLGQFCLMKYLFRTGDSPAPTPGSESK